MSLCELIDRIEKNEWLEEDFEHPLARAILEEIVEGKENPLQKKLFDDAKILADHIIERYVTLPREDKLKMAEVYWIESKSVNGAKQARRGAFQELRGLNYGTRNRIAGVVGVKNSQLLTEISNFSKITPFLEEYALKIEGDKKISILQSSLHYFFKKKGRYSLTETDLRTGKIANYRVDEFCNSLKNGINEELMKRISDISILLPHRISMLEEYIDNIENQEYPKVSDANFRAFYQERKTPWARFDFQKGKNGLMSSNLLHNMMWKVPDELRERVIDAEHFVKVRERILRNYIGYRKKGGELPIYEYVRTHTIKGEEVGRNNSHSLSTFIENDFRRPCSKQGARWKPGEKRHYFESLTYRVKDGDLVNEARSYISEEGDFRSLVKRIENNQWEERDYEHPLARTIVEELIVCKNEEHRKRLLHFLLNRTDSVVLKYFCFTGAHKEQLAQNYIERETNGKSVRVISDYVHRLFTYEESRGSRKKT